MNEMLILLIIITSSFLSKAMASTEASVAAGTFYENNTFYEDDKIRGDGFFRVKPQLKIEKEGEVIGLKTDLSGSYNKYLRFANQDYFDYQGALGIPINQFGAFAAELAGDIQAISDPAVTDVVHYTRTEGKTKKTAARIDHQVMGAGAKINWQMSSLSLINVKARYHSEDYADAYHNYLNNQGFDASAFYDYQFLPETVFYIGGTGGALTFPSGTKNSKFKTDPPATDPGLPFQLKYDSTYYSGRAGVRGRLAERTRVDASAAFLIRLYTVGSGFSEPVFNLKVEEQFGPKDLLLAGFDYDVKDSKFTNYVIDQTTYMGYARILGDQILLLTRMQYTYSSYSKPYKREDQRLAAAFRIDYSLSPSSKISGLLDVDILNSDSYLAENLISDGQIDPRASYQFFRTGLEFTQYF